MRRRAEDGEAEAERAGNANNDTFRKRVERRRVQNNMQGVEEKLRSPISTPSGAEARDDATSTARNFPDTNEEQDIGEIDDEIRLHTPADGRSARAAG